MKKYFNIIVILFLAICCSSCLDANLEELDTYEGKEITGVVGVYHRLAIRGFCSQRRKESTKCSIYRTKTL